MKPAADLRSPVGSLLREWRTVRRMSQLDLAAEAGLSTRHLSCIETGKAQASREAISRLADALHMPLRERNALMLAAGYAPHFAETPLVTPALERMRAAVDLILRQQEPYPAFVLNRHWDTLQTNQAAVRMDNFLLQGERSRHTNMLHQVFDPADFRQVIVNWSDVAAQYLRYLHDEIAKVPTDTRARQLLNDLLRYPGVPARWQFRELENEPAPILTMVFRSRAGELRFFETVTTFVAPHDVTLDELRIECAYPADEHTAAVCARLADEAQS